MIGGTGGSASGEELAWVEVREPFEVVEIIVTADVRLAMADELRPTTGAELPDIYNRCDPLLWAVAASIRSTASNGMEMDGLRIDEIGRLALARMMFEHMGARRRRSNAMPFDRRRLGRVAEFVDANLHRKLSLKELAAVGALSPYHFLRAFREATGSTPHAFVTARKMEHALWAIREGVPVDVVASSVGYANNHSFRSQFRRHIGALPSQAREP